MSKSRNRLRRPLSPSEKAKKQYKPSTFPRALPEDISTQEGKHDKNKYYWHIFYKGKRAGRAIIKITELDKLNVPFITIELNNNCRGLGIGRIVFDVIFQMSDFPEIYALVRKNNISSIKSLEYAGYSLTDKTKSGQLLYLRKRNIK